MLKFYLFLFINFKSDVCKFVDNHYIPCGCRYGYPPSLWFGCLAVHVTHSPLDQFGPGGPCGPLSPFAPLSPFGPCGPCGPFGPFTP